MSLGKFTKKVLINLIQGHSMAKIQKKVRLRQINTYWSLQNNQQRKQYLTLPA